MTSIPGVQLLRRSPHADERGRFVEIFRASEVQDAFVQSNHSTSKQGVVRGLHYHRHQADLWYVTAGRAQVGLVDLRTPDVTPATETVLLGSDDPAALYIPAGVAHGFAALTDVELIYWVTTEYDASDEFGIAWDDPQLGIQWELTDPLLSDRDRTNPPLDWNDIPRF
ncbi:MAG TPA: dTDP-4-dehydrorhamnose 3,5-epimerase family protein [Actinomycetota bacterium]|nr:dTDP-4-dehydrorhamnose 3,5-epimerase family protein [Actinomycetota bacterium]